MENLIYEKDGGYFIRGEHQEPGSEEGRSELTQWQYDSITNLQAGQRVSGDLSEASIVKLHAEQDPSSPLFEGSEPVNSGVSGTAAEKPVPATAYYEPTADKVDPIADAAPEPQGTTAISTEEATKPYEAPEPEAEPTPAVETPVEAETIPATADYPAHIAVQPTEEDASITGA